MQGLPSFDVIDQTDPFTLMDPTFYAVPGFNNLSTFSLDPVTIMLSADAQQAANGYNSAGSDPSDIINRESTFKHIALEWMLICRYSNRELLRYLNNNTLPTPNLHITSLRLWLLGWCVRRLHNTSTTAQNIY
jgi:hypothetical protein